MADLKFLGINIPTITTQRQANPTSDALLMSTYRPSGGSTPFTISPVLAIGPGGTLFDLQDGAANSILDISNVAGTFVGTFDGDWILSGDLEVQGAVNLSGGPHIINSSVVLGGDSSDTTTLARGWSDNSTDFSYSAGLILDPSDTPSFGSNGTAHILIGTGTGDPDATGFPAPQGSLLLNLDGSLWMKTGALATDWDKFITTVGAAPVIDLQDAYDQGQSIDTSALDTALSIAHTDGTGTHNLLELNKSPSSSVGGSGLSVTMGASSTGFGLSVNSSGSGAASDLTQSGSATNISTWRSGAGASNERMTISRTGVLTVNSAPTSDSGVGGAPVASSPILLSSSAGGIPNLSIITTVSDPGAGTGIQANAGSFAFASNGTAWIKTGAPATDWSQVPTSVVAASDLNTVITSAPTDNEADVPSSDPLIFNDGGVAGFDLLSLNRTATGSGNALNIIMGGSTTGPAIDLTIPSSSVALSVADGTSSLNLTSTSLLGLNGTDILLSGGSSTSSDGGSLTVQGGDTTFASSTAGSLILQAGDATGGSSTGGDTVIRAGTGTSTNGDIQIGQSDTASITVGTSSIPTTLFHTEVVGASGNPSVQLNATGAVTAGSYAVGVYDDPSWTTIGGSAVDDLQSILDTIDSAIASVGGGGTTDADLIVFDPDGDITSTNVQDALVEVRDDTDTKLSSKVDTSTQIIAGAGLTGGGTLSTDRTLNVIANADGSIAVNANDIQVGILASDSQHGTRGGGTQHAVATTGAAGFMSAADKTAHDANVSKLSGIESGADVTDTANVTSAGALMRTGGTMTGNITFSGAQTFDGRDLSVDGSKLDSIETGADVTDTANVTAAGALMLTGGTMTGNITFSGAQTFDGRDLSVDGSKLDTIEPGADVTDTANVTTAGALMRTGGTMTGDIVFNSGQEFPGTETALTVVSVSGTSDTIDDTTRATYRTYTANDDGPDVDITVDSGTAGDWCYLHIQGTAGYDLVDGSGVTATTLDGGTNLKVTSITEDVVWKVVWETSTRVWAIQVSPDDSKIEYITVVNGQSPLEGGETTIQATSIYISGTGVAVTNPLGGGIAQVVITDTDTTDADSLVFDPDGDITSTDVQAAIVEVRDDTDIKLASKAPAFGLTKTVSDPTYTLTDADNGYLIRFTHPSGCDISVNTGLTPGCTVECFRETSAIIQIAGSSTATPYAVGSYTGSGPVEQYGSMIIRYLSATEFTVYGDL